MTEKRFYLVFLSELGVDAIKDNNTDKHLPLNNERICNLLNTLNDENNQLRLQLNLCSDQRNEFHRGARENANRVGKLKKENEQLKSKNETYKNMFFEIVETALTDKNCRELYCKGILDIFDKANSLNQAREMIKEHLK